MEREGLLQSSEVILSSITAYFAGQLCFVQGHVSNTLTI